MKELFKYHFDFIKLKLYNVDRRDLNWKKLVPHKNLKRHFTLNSEGRFFDKNFDLFLDGGNNLTIRTSLPYLKYGHNYKAFDERQLSKLISSLSLLLNVDLTQAKILEIEFGCYQKIKSSAKDFIDNLIGLKDYNIEKTTQRMKMFGNRKGLHFKIYDPKANAKSKKTFSISKYSEDDLIKYELKFLNLKNTALISLCTKEVFSEFKTALNRHVNELVIQQEFDHLPVESSVNHILFTVLKNIEQQSKMSVYNQISKVLDKMNLSASQKSKRRKSLMKLENIYNEKAN
jgi:hypothetical protein